MNKAKNKHPVRFAIYLVLLTTLVAAGVIATILEGDRIKKENELLSYEVW